MSDRQRIPGRWFKLYQGINISPDFWGRVAAWVNRTGINDLDAAPDDVVKAAIAAQTGNDAAKRLERAIYRGIPRLIGRAEQMMVRRAPVPPKRKVLVHGRIDTPERGERIPRVPKHLLGRVKEGA